LATAYLKHSSKRVNKLPPLADGVLAGIGSRSEEVRDLQGMLASLGYLKNTMKTNDVDGIYGNRTHNALIQCMRENDIYPSNHYDAAVKAALKKLVAKDTSDLSDDQVGMTATNYKQYGFIAIIGSIIASIIAGVLK
jgi:peptidoglycan hydrolase-like protein with peptidoglycan-binding domain